jgi:hypothetical protein
MTKGKGAKVVDLVRAKAALARLDALVAAHPELTSPEAQARLAEAIKEEKNRHDEANEGETGKTPDGRRARRNVRRPRVER